MSRVVNAFELPPFDSMILSYSFGGTFFEPLNIMCSKKCEIPVMPGRSLREPTLYHCQNVTAGTVWSSCRSTTGPFFSTWRWCGHVAADRARPVAGFDCGGPVAAKEVTAMRHEAENASATMQRMRSPCDREGRESTTEIIRRSR